VEVHKHIP